MPFALSDRYLGNNPLYTLILLSKPSILLALLLRNINRLSVWRNVTANPARIQVLRPRHVPLVKIAFFARAQGARAIFEAGAAEMAAGVGEVGPGAHLGCSPGCARWTVR